MILGSTIRPAWAIARAMWSAQRTGFLSLLLMVPVCAVLFHWARPRLQDRDVIDALACLPMGLSLFLTFVFCNFTEADRRGRLEGFPARLFTLPVPTWILIMAPVLFSVMLVGGMYAAWAKIALPALGMELPLSWPSLYLATGVTCYQAIVWTLARFRLARLMVLGMGGTVLAIGWDAFRDGFERELVTSWLPIPSQIPVRTVLCILMVVLSFIALVIAYFAVESQRRGGSLEWPGPRRFVERVSDALPRRQQPFRSPASAQVWYEWRRHGILLPLAVAGVLVMIMIPSAIHDGELSAETTDFTLGWILFLPLLLAFALGQGFGKGDLWSKESALPVFFATRPLTIPAWIATKMKAAALASLSAWLVVLIFTPWWLCQWCDCKDLLEMCAIVGRIYPSSILWAAPALVLGILVILTWRLLAGSLFIGFSGKGWMLTTAVCGVFMVLLGTPFVVLSLSLHPKAAAHFLRLPAWFPWLLAALFCGKAAVAWLLTDRAWRLGWVGSRPILRYLALWLAVTTFLVLAAWLLIPVAGWLKWLAVLSSLFVMPLASVACAPMALARSRRH